jgi:hypothetical protein
VKRTHQILLLFVLWTLQTKADGIPEPDLILYGTVTQNGTRLTVGTLTWTFQPSGGGQFVTVSAPLTNINDQFSYVLRVPCETAMPGQILSSNTLQIAPGSYTYNRAQVFVNGTNAAILVAPPQNAMTLSGSDRGHIERVDLVISGGVTDSDGDGLPDDWEQQYFGGNANPGDDPDGDGMSNLAEYKAGSDPTDPNSRFAFISVQPHAQGGILVQWSSAQGEAYELQRSSDLVTGFSAIQSNIAATPPVNSYHDVSAAGAGPYFYRLRLHE